MGTRPNVSSDLLFSIGYLGHSELFREFCSGMVKTYGYLEHSELFREFCSGMIKTYGYLEHSELKSAPFLRIFDGPLLRNLGYLDRKCDLQRPFGSDKFSICLSRAFEKSSDDRKESLKFLDQFFLIFWNF